MLQCPICQAPTVGEGWKIVLGPCVLGKCTHLKYQGQKVPEKGASVYYCKQSHAGGPGCHLEKDQLACLEDGKIVWWERQS